MTQIYFNGGCTTAVRNRNDRQPTAPAMTTHLGVTAGDLEDAAREGDGHHRRERQEEVRRQGDGVVARRRRLVLPAHHRLVRVGLLPQEPVVVVQVFGHGGLGLGGRRCLRCLIVRRRRFSCCRRRQEARRRPLRQRPVVCGVCDGCGDSSMCAVNSSSTCSVQPLRILLMVLTELASVGADVP